MNDEMASAGASVGIVSEAHGPHWVAWAVRGADRKPVGSVVLVGQTKEEAEERARSWATKLAARSQP